MEGDTNLYNPKPHRSIGNSAIPVLKNSILGTERFKTR